MNIRIMLQLLRDARHRICNDAPQKVGDDWVPPLKNPTYGPLLKRLDDACDELAAKPAPAVVAWVLVDKVDSLDRSQAFMTDENPAGGGLDTYRAAADAAHPERAPFRWAPLVLGEVKA